MSLIAESRQPRSPRVRERRAPRRIGLWIACGWLLLTVLAAIAPGLLAPHEPLEQHLDAVLAPPFTEYLLGTDAVGRDVLSRIIWGAQPALLGIAIAMSVALILGVLWGTIAGYVGGVVDMLLMRTADVVLAFPGIVLSIAISAIFGGSLQVTMIAVGFAMSPSIARLMRSGAIVVRDREYVEASRMYGYGTWHRMLRHVFPNSFVPVLVQVTTYAGLVLLAQTGLAFLGIGVLPPWPSWGTSLGESYRYMSFNIWMTVIPGVVVVLTVLALFTVGDRIRDRFAERAQG